MTAHVDRTAGLEAARANRIRLRRRRTVVTVSLGAVTFLVFAVIMLVGGAPLTLGDVLTSLTRSVDEPAVDFIVLELRLPIAVTGLVVGMALGVAGLIFQTLLANPLASPDLIGISSGASLFAVSSIVFLHASAFAIAGSAVLGALCAAAMIYSLAWRDGLTSYRFILVGIGITELMLALVSWVLSKAEINDARQAMTWLVGSVGQAGAMQLNLAVLSVVVLVPLSVVSGRALQVLELGDDSAHALGLRIERWRLTLMVIAIVLVALATAAAGPLAFVALAAGPIAGRLLRGAGIGLLAAGFVGAIIVLTSELVATYVLPVSLPTGVITGAVGAPYLVWLIATVNREGRGG
ncbi:FecCD family ABC transporter permease [Mycolicibacterium sp. A43C]